MAQRSTFGTITVPGNRIGATVSICLVIVAWLALPALAVEVLSPNDRIGKVTRRVQEMLRAGVILVWLVDPESCEVIVHRGGQAPYIVDQAGELTGDDVLPEFRCAVKDFFLSPGEENGGHG